MSDINIDLHYWRFILQHFIFVKKTLPAVCEWGKRTYKTNNVAQLQTKPIHSSYKTILLQLEWYATARKQIT